jgi:hypothetical protein
MRKVVNQQSVEMYGYLLFVGKAQCIIIDEMGLGQGFETVRHTQLFIG